jgi:CubicO group peptidase (beta-lactamase class C family)
LDDDVSPKLGFDLRNPNFPEDKITYRMLLTHTSSLLDTDKFEDFIYYIKEPSNPIPSLKDLVTPNSTWFSTDLFRADKPGSVFKYANVNFGIIATLMEKMTGRRFDEYMRDRIFRPIGIKGSFNIDDLNQSDIENIAVLYKSGKPSFDKFNGVAPPKRDFSTYEVGSNGFLFAPQAGLRLTSRELARIAQLIMNQGSYGFVQILKASTVQLLGKKEWLFNGNNSNSSGLF